MHLQSGYGLPDVYVFVNRHV